MVDQNVSEMEKKLLRILAKMFDAGNNCLRTPLADLQKEGLEVDQQSLDVLLRTMQHYGAIENISATNAQEFRLFYISAKASQLARELDEAERQPGDIVAQIKVAARSNKYIAWAIIVFLSLTTIVVLLNQTMDLLQKFGVIAKP